MKAFYATLLAALMSVSLFAADQPGSTDEALNKPDKQANLTYRQRMVAGKVMDIKEADVTQEGKTENHLLLKVGTHSGREVIVDVGPKAGLKGEIKNGDEIAAFGITGRLNDRPLIVASKIATIVPIEGREDVFEMLPADFDQQPGTKETGMKSEAPSNQQLAKDAIRQSNDNDADNKRLINTGPRQVSGFRSPCLDE